MDSSRTAEEIANGFSLFDLSHNTEEGNSYLDQRNGRRPPSLQSYGSGSAPPLDPSAAPPRPRAADLHVNGVPNALMTLGRQELMMREAEVNRKIIVRSNNQQRVGLTGVELSQLHNQLTGITTTCTLIIGFSMGALSADLLSAMGDDSSLFCIYKSPGAAVLSGVFILCTITCICACFTIIACVQIIIFQSECALFSRSMSHAMNEVAGKRVNLTQQVVRMTQLLMYGDGDRSAEVSTLKPSPSSGPSAPSNMRWFGRKTVISTSFNAGSVDADTGLSLPPEVRRRLELWARKRLEQQVAQPERAKNRKSNVLSFGFTIYMGLAVALSSFFVSVVVLVWIFLGPLVAWHHVSVANASLSGANENPFLMQTQDGEWKTRCLDPTNNDDVAYMQMVGTAISSCSTAVFIIYAIIGSRLARQTHHRYSLSSLLALAMNDEAGTSDGNMSFEVDETSLDTSDTAAGQYTRAVRLNRRPQGPVLSA
jgi:hypothetical protein